VRAHRVVVEPPLFDGQPGTEASSNNTISVSRGQAKISVSVDVDFDGGVLEGYVEPGDEEPTNAAIIANNKSTGESFPGRANRQGRFLITGLPSGQYDLYAWRDVKGIPYATQFWLEKYELGKQVVTVSEGEAVGNLSLPLLNK
jgi:hypothetical protein